MLKKNIELLQLQTDKSYRQLSREAILDNPERAKNCSPKDFLGRVIEIGDYVGYTIKFPKSGLALGYVTAYQPPTMSPENNPDGGYVTVKRIEARKFGKPEMREEFRAEGRTLVRLSKEEMTLLLLEKGTK